MNVINISHGSFLILAAFFAYSLWHGTGMDPLITVAITTPAMFALGWAIYLLAVRRVRGAPPASSVLLTFSIALVIEGVMGLVWGNPAHATRPASFNESFNVGSIFLPKAQVSGALLALALLAELYVVLNRTWL